MALIINNGRAWSGTNNCDNEQRICPRIGYPTGTHYEMCKEICKQQGHAEEMACKQAGEEARGGTLYLAGHTYACDNCIKIMKQYGIKRLMICDTLEEIIL
jgi:deoxycytidylate deaminase